MTDYMIGYEKGRADQEKKDMDDYFNCDEYRRGFADGVKSCDNMSNAPITIYRRMKDDNNTEAPLGAFYDCWNSVEFLHALIGDAWEHDWNNHHNDNDYQTNS